MGTRILMIEMAQIEDSKKIEALTTTVSLQNFRLELLLTECSQAINLAKIVYLEHEKHDEHCISVMGFPNSSSNVKKGMKD